VKLAPLNKAEGTWLAKFAASAASLEVATEAVGLLGHEVDADVLRDLRITATSALCGDAVAMKRWGAASPHACDLARIRTYKHGQKALDASPLWLAVLYAIAETVPPPPYMFGIGYLDQVPGTGLAWTLSSQMTGPTRIVR
jgi:hypothetical protein